MPSGYGEGRLQEAASQTRLIPRMMDMHHETGGGATPTCARGVWCWAVYDDEKKAAGGEYVSKTAKRMCTRMVSTSRT